MQCDDGCLRVDVVQAMSPVCRGTALFIPRSRLVGCGVTGWLDGVVKQLCGAVNYDNGVGGHLTFGHLAEMQVFLEEPECQIFYK